MKKSGRIQFLLGVHLVLYNRSCSSSSFNTRTLAHIDLQYCKTLFKKFGDGLSRNTLSGLKDILSINKSKEIACIKTRFLKVHEDAIVSFLADAKAFDLTDPFDINPLNKTV